MFAVLPYSWPRSTAAVANVERARWCRKGFVRVGVEAARASCPPGMRLLTGGTPLTGRKRVPDTYGEDALIGACYACALQAAL